MRQQGQQAKTTLSFAQQGLVVALLTLLSSEALIQNPKAEAKPPKGQNQT